MSGILSLERSEQILSSGLCNSAATSIVYLFTSFLGSDVNVERRCIVYRVNIHILICTLNVRETSDDWQTGILNISWTSRGFCGGCPWDLENCIVTMSVFVYDAVDLCKYSTKKIYVMFSLKCMSSGQKILRESLYRTILWSLFHLLKGMSVRMEHATASSSSSDGVEIRLQELRSSAVTRGRAWLQDALANISVMELRKMECNRCYLCHHAIELVFVESFTAYTNEFAPLFAWGNCSWRTCYMSSQVLLLCKYCSIL